MESAKPLRPLSEAYKQLYERVMFRARCQNCKEVFIDDMPLLGTIRCPNCPEFALYRTSEPKTVPDIPKVPPPPPPVGKLPPSKALNEF
jgi:DNA-directed RNA polymerase subunit RPC12/RpoP